MPAVPRLIAAAADVCTQKIIVAARAAGVDLRLEAAPTRVIPELHRGNLVVRYTNAILRWVGRVTQTADIYGSSFFESAQVDSWLDWSELELAYDSPPFLTAAIDTLEKHLSDRVFLVGQRFTLADVSVSCSLHHLQQQGQIKELPQGLRRWLGTCTTLDAYKGVLDVPVVAPSPTTERSLELPTSTTTAPAITVGGVFGAAEGRIASYTSLVGGRTRVSWIVDAEDGGLSLVNQTVTVCGWARTKREQARGKLVFIELTDGSSPHTLQIVVDKGIPGFEQLKSCYTGASLKITGLVKASPGSGQKVELSCCTGEHEVQLFGGCDPEEYPLAKKEHSYEYLRTIAHLRPRAVTIAAIQRVRSALALATHVFFQAHGFHYIHTPIITASDCEGAGEMFQVTTAIKDGNVKCPIDYTQDFFGRTAFLTVSGQLSVENYCCALSNVYTFGPTFRAEDSHTSRHLAEFWMIEPELAFADLHDNMNCSEDYLKSCIQHVLKYNRADVEYISKAMKKPELIPQLEDWASKRFVRMSYTEAVEVLIKESAKTSFKVPVEWGIDLGSEHERYLTEKVTKIPTYIYNYPKDIKSFYMKMNDDGKTVQAMDCLVPGIGEVIGGSVREERLEYLDKRLDELKLDKSQYWWYRDLRSFGTVPHAGFGLGFERLIMLCTGVENIRDVIPYPRYPGHAEF